MAGILSESFRKVTAKHKDSRMKEESSASVAYATGFLNFDFMNGTVVHVKNDKGEKYQYNSTGIVDGSMVMVIGRSGCGKTTWIMQAASAIIKPFETSCIFHDDIEGGITKTRKEQLTHLSGDDFNDR